jgi:hypothetical protein
MGEFISLDVVLECFGFPRDRETFILNFNNPIHMPGFHLDKHNAIDF